MKLSALFDKALSETKQQEKDYVVFFCVDNRKTNKTYLLNYCQKKKKKFINTYCPGVLQFQPLRKKLISVEQMN